MDFGKLILSIDKRLHKQDWEVIMKKEYVEQHDQGYWVAGTRVSLDSVVIAFLDGLSPETIVAECFPALTLEQVFGAIAYYLANRVEIDTYLQSSKAEFEALRQTMREADPQFYQKLAEARRQTQMSPS